MIFDDNLKIIFAYFFIKTYVVGAHWNHPTEAVLMSTHEAILMSTHNIGFYEEISKSIP